MGEYLGCLLMRFFLNDVGDWIGFCRVEFVLVKFQTFGSGGGEN